MSTKPNDNAFPMDGMTRRDNGLTKREFFAALAMQGLCASGLGYPGNLAHSAVQYADALIAELNKEEK